jgi:nitroreductase
VSPPIEVVRTVVELAGLAPSVHNSQPWHFTWDGRLLELREDRSRALEVLDRSGRERVVSCGAALINARLCFADLGWASTTTLLPEGDDGELLAVVEPTEQRSPTQEEHELTAAAVRRATDRDPYDARPVPVEVLAVLRAAADAEGGWLHVVDAEEELELDVLLSRADAAQRSDPEYLAELEAWRTESGPTGVPTRALPTVPASARGSSLSLRDFDAGHGGSPESSAEPSEDAAPVPEHPTVLVLGTEDDTRRDWLVAGQSLGRVLLHATVAGIAAQPVTSVLEVPVLRARLRAALGLVGHPQMVLRAGYGTHGPASHRLPVDEVLDVVAR